MRVEEHTLQAGRSASLARIVNLVIPGGGLILIGLEWLGVLVALLFAISANYAILATFILPDEVSRIWRGLGLGVAVGTYLGAQIRFAQTLRDSRRQEHDAVRRRALAGARIALGEGRVEDAWQVLLPIHHLADRDLLVAYRIAQVLTARGDEPASAAAWSRVKCLDRHRIYYRELSEYTRMLVDCDRLPPADNPPSTDDV